MQSTNEHKSVLLLSSLSLFLSHRQSLPTQRDSSREPQVNHGMLRAVRRVALQQIPKLCCSPAVRKIQASDAPLPLHNPTQKIMNEIFLKGSSLPHLNILPPKPPAKTLSSLIASSWRSRAILLPQGAAAPPPRSGLILFCRSCRASTRR